MFNKQVITKTKKNRKEKSDVIEKPKGKDCLQATGL